MLSIDIAAFKKSLDQAADNIQRKMEGAVAEFASEIAEIASDNTPIGDSESILYDGAYREYYKYRQNEFGLPLEAGYHKGAWKYTENGDLNFVPQIDSFNKSEIESEGRASYKLGDTFQIAAIGPGFADLERGSSEQRPDGILTPSVDQIVSFYSISFPALYNKQR